MHFQQNTITNLLLKTRQEKEKRVETNPTLEHSVGCPAKLSNFFEDFNKIVSFIETQYVFNNKEV